MKPRISFFVKVLGLLFLLTVVVIICSWIWYDFQISPKEYVQIPTNQTASGASPRPIPLESGTPITKGIQDYKQQTVEQANSTEHLRKIEADKISAQQDCELAKSEYENRLRELGLSQDVTLRLESSVDSDEFVTVDVYITYNSYDFESRKDLKEQTKNVVATLLYKYLVTHFPKSHISANLHENNLNPNWDK